MTPAMMDVKGLATMLRCSTKSVERMTATGRIPAPVKLGHLCRWPIASVEKWISDGCAPVKGRR